MRSARRSSARTGFVLMATLWLIVGIATIVLTTNAAAIQHALGSRNRTNSRRAYWRALGCLAQARSRADDALDHTENPESVWESLAQVITADEGGDCRIEATATGMTLNVNRASALALRVTAERAGLGVDRVDSVVRLLGPQRAQPFSSVEELREVGNGMLDRFGIGTLFGVDTETVNLGRAPAAVVAGALSDAAPPATAEGPGAGMMHPYMPDRIAAWWLSSYASVGDPPSTTTVAFRLVLVGRRAAIQEVRTW